MPVLRSESQKQQPLRAFYEELSQSSDSITQDIGKTMLKWIACLEQERPDLNLWGLTSHYHLALMAKPDADEANKSVILIGSTNAYQVKYLLPADQAPWKNAYVEGETADFEEAVKWSLIGIERCGAWD